MSTPNFSNNFNGYQVLNEIIEQRGKTHVFFMNGVLLPDFNSQQTAIANALKINPNTDLPSSMKLDGAYNPTALPSMEEVANIITTSLAAGTLGGLLGALIGLVLGIVATAVRVAVGVAIDTFEALYQIYSDDTSKSDPINESWTGRAKEWLSPTSKDSVIFIPHSQGNLFVEDGLRFLNPDLIGLDS